MLLSARRELGLVVSLAERSYPGTDSDFGEIIPGLEAIACAVARLHGWVLWILVPVAGMLSGFATPRWPPWRPIWRIRGVRRNGVGRYYTASLPGRTPRPPPVLEKPRDHDPRPVSRGAKKVFAEGKLRKLS